MQVLARGLEGQRILEFRVYVQAGAGGAKDSRF